MTAVIVRATIGGIKRRWVVGKDCRVRTKTTGGGHRGQILGMMAVVGKSKVRGTAGDGRGRPGMADEGRGPEKSYE